MHKIISKLRLEIEKGFLYSKVIDGVAVLLPRNINLSKCFPTR